jgi:ferredoxin
MAVELSIARSRCNGSGLCAELLPEMIQLDDWGYPVLSPGPIPDRLTAHAERAVAMCPVLALKLRRRVEARA